MAERLTHKRSKGPVSTPAARLVELQNALSAAERDRDQSKISFLRLHESMDRLTTIGGVSVGGVRAAQSWVDLILWEVVLNDNPDLDAIFEIGTWKGGFSWWLDMQARARNIFFETYDAVIPDPAPPGFRRIDVFAEHRSLGRRFRDWEPCVVLCDGGNKPRELRTFADELVDEGSLLFVHDWGTEMMPEDVPDTVEEIYGDLCDELGSSSRVFRLRRDP